jgi:hypothetical protein
MPGLRKDTLDELIDFTNLRHNYEKYIYLFSKYKNSEDFKEPVPMRQITREKLNRKFSHLNLHRRNSDDNRRRSSFDSAAEDESTDESNEELQRSIQHYLENLRRHSRFLIETLRNGPGKNEPESPGDSGLAEDHDHSDILNLSFLILTKQHRFVSYPKLDFRQKMIGVYQDSASNAQLSFI